MRNPDDRQFCIPFARSPTEEPMDEQKRVSASTSIQAPLKDLGVFLDELLPGYNEGLKTTLAPTTYHQPVIKLAGIEGPTPQPRPQ